MTLSSASSYQKTPMSSLSMATEEEEVLADVNDVEVDDEVGWCLQSLVEVILHQGNKLSVYG